MPPKKKQKCEDEDEEGKAVLVTYEKFDSTMLGNLALLEMDNAVQEEAIMNLNRQWNMTGGSSLRVVYNPTKNHPTGRLIGKSIAKSDKGAIIRGPCSQSLPGWVRRLTQYKLYHDIDMAKSGSRIFHQICMKKLGYAPVLNERYLYHTEGLLQYFVGSGLPLTSKTLKILMQRTLCLGKAKNFLVDLGLDGTEPYEPLGLLYTEFKDCADKLAVHADYMTMFAQCIKDTQEDAKPNPMSLFVSRIVEEVECQCLLAMHEHLTTKEDRAVGPLIYDGLQTKRLDSCKFPALLELDVLRRIEFAVLNKTSFEVVLVEKSMAPTEQDLKLAHGPLSLKKIPKEEYKAIEIVTQTAQAGGYMRYQDSIMEWFPGIPGVTREVCSQDDFINRACRDEDFRIKPKAKAEVKVWFKAGCDDVRFPVQEKYDYRFINFRNGFVNKQDKDENGQYCLSFTPWDEHKGDPPVTDHFFDMDLTPEAFEGLAPTPLFDQIVDAQLGSGTPMKNILMAFFGRAFYPINLLDRWQTMLFILGDGNTGKGTVLELLKAMMPPASTGYLDDNLEQSGFGLYPLSQKRLVLVMDAPQEFSKKLPRVKFNNMVSGEGVGLPVKHKAAEVDSNWTVPMMMAANQLFDYLEGDTGNAAGRRTLVLPFRNLVSERDTTLKDRIIHTELVSLLMRCLRAYFSLRKQIGDLDFWKHVDPSILAVNKKLKQEGDPLSEFLDSPSAHHRISFEAGAHTVNDDLRKQYKNFMEFQYLRKGQSLVMTNDQNPMKIRGYVYETWHYCFICKNKCSTSRCGAHYNKNGNQTKVWVNMKMEKFKPLTYENHPSFRNVHPQQ